ncbi:hypothetical protein Asulf_00588 [Archaeoglobus sulfaticallidus PM70-1]|uniref:Uncharacterized protein n=1 Tax=Archaeoglobus sulfaticallidus PM70-1 TaxID=387631 RepID=N0BC96_9EURY|nr:arginase family protein [Archaeoglobus sulfaticallidus]AGK60608.1 hypothetical protein Asulf_00588 [Archaeoglobus sulfaticallidus PM70-1]
MKSFRRPPKEFFEVLTKLSKLKVVGADLVEICPSCDYSDMTSLLGAKIVRELIVGVFLNILELLTFLSISPQPHNSHFNKLYLARCNLENDEIPAFDSRRNG